MRTKQVKNGHVVQHIRHEIFEGVLFHKHFTMATFLIVANLITIIKL